jgi:dihydrofolate synthase/folylpolyglutamate synthase
MKNTYNINDLYNKTSEDDLLNKIISLAGKEGYRPKLDHLKSLLAQDVQKIESKGIKVVVIAGTNGKGGTTHALRYLLERDSKNVSVWTSPHVMTILERMVIGSANISYEQLSNAIDEHTELIKREGLSFYELLLYVFIKEVANSNSDYLLLEVGLGGRFDAVNIFSNPLTAITSISRDHTQILGNKLKDILFEKYGVTRQGGTLYSAVEQKSLQETLKLWTKRDNIQFTQLSLNDSLSYEMRNRSLAQELYSELCQKPASPPFQWPMSKGRREKVTFRDRDFIFIGAHNLDGHRKMLKMLKDEEVVSNDDVLVLSFSTGREDQVSQILDLYRSYPCLFSHKFITSFDGERSIPGDFLKEKTGDGFEFMSEWNDLLDDKYRSKKIIISGSYFFISEVQKFFNMFTSNT